MERMMLGFPNITVWYIPIPPYLYNKMQVYVKVILLLWIFQAEIDFVSEIDRLIKAYRPMLNILPAGSHKIQ